MFVIIKSYINVLGEKSPVYAKVTNPFEQGEQLSRKEAMEIVRENGFTIAHQDSDGIIWESPDREWFKKHKGCFAAAEARKREQAAVQRERRKQLFGAQ